MAPLVYSVICSLDGYVADASGSFEWAAPDEEVHAFVNDLERGVGTYLYGRRIYDVMAVWETWPLDTENSAAVRDYAAIWRAADKVVYSRTLDTVTTERTRLEREFDAEAVRRMKDAADAPISVGGPTLAAHALRAGLVDECHVLLHPVTVGGGIAVWPHDVRLQLELVDARRFDSGVTHAHYRVRPT